MRRQAHSCSGTVLDKLHPLMIDEMDLVQFEEEAPLVSGFGLLQHYRLISAFEATLVQ